MKQIKKLRLGKLGLLVLVSAVLLAFSSCGSGVGEQTEESSTPDAAGDEANGAAQEKLSTAGTGKKMIRLGSSLYAVQINQEFYPNRVTNADWEDDMVAHYTNMATSQDFTVYQFSKEGYADTLDDFVREEADEYEAIEVVTGEDLNGVAMGYYRSMEIYSEMEYEGITFAMDAGSDYLELDFRFMTVDAETVAWEIMKSLRIVGSKPLALGTYTISIPEDFTLVSDETDGSSAYASGSGSLHLYIDQTGAEGKTLSDFALGSGGSDIETDAEINGIPVAYYRAVKAFDDAYHSVRACVIPEGSPDAPSGFTILTFRLDGISAEKETRDILNTLEKSVQ